MSSNSLLLAAFLFGAALLTVSSPVEAADPPAKPADTGKEKKVDKAMPKSKPTPKPRTPSGGKGGLLGEILGAILEKVLEEKVEEAWAGEYEGKKYPVISSVTAGGHADKAGVKVGDAWIKYNGTSLEDETRSNDAALKAIDSARRQGVKTVTLVFVRDGKEYEAKVDGGVKIGVTMRTWK